MTTGYVVDLANGHGGYCIEILQGVTACGARIPGDADREVYAVERGHEHAHNSLCFDCSKTDSRALREAARERGQS